MKKLLFHHYEKSIKDVKAGSLHSVFVVQIEWVLIGNIVSKGFDFVCPTISALIEDHCSIPSVHGNR